jgi:hypothetical protein
MRRLEVEYASPSCVLMRGPGARELITEVRGRAPVWATLSRAWVCQPSTAVDVVALAEMRGYGVTVTLAPDEDKVAGKPAHPTSSDKTLEVQVGVLRDVGLW